jgi:hypothetical protein
MRVLRLHSAALALSLLTFASVAIVAPAPVANAQSAVTGAISGVVADGTGAVVPGATVTFINTGTNAKLVVTTNAEGRYTAPQLAPGTYKVSATAAGLQSETSMVNVLIGTEIPVDLKVTPTADKTIVEVSATSLPLVDTQNVALATTFTAEQIAALPTPGGDVTTVAFTAPGVVVNTGGGYGNFSSNGLPGISNLFVLNGFDNQDPFLNLNNSGSSNLTLGQGELAEATVIQNGYSSEYGRAAGAIIEYTTKSGTNRFHGMADYNYNGTVLNANGWFNQFYNGPGTRPHAVSNQWATNFGGPIIKDKLFFFSDYEGLHYVLPDTSGPVTVPSSQLEAYIMANAPASVQGLYGQYFTAFKNATAIKGLAPVANGTAPNQDQTGGIVNALTGSTGALGCGLNQPAFGTSYSYGGLTGTAAPGGGVFGVTVPCMEVGTAAANNINIEWLFTQRIDWKINDKQSIWGRFKVDHGTQPTSTSFITPLFSATSIQPEYEGQFNHTYVISPTKTNSLVLAANWYSAYFGPENVGASLNALPLYWVADAGADFSGVNSAAGLPAGGVPYYLTQGRNVTQYQIEDDFNWIKGKHTLRFGGNFRRDLVSDYDSQEEVIFPLAVQDALGDFSSGTINGSGSVFAASQSNYFQQAFTATMTGHLALYNLGVYAQDEFQARPNLKLTIGVRVDRTGNPLCHNGCFGQYTGSFPASGVTASTPYNWAAGGQIKANTWNAFPSQDLANIQPRFGANYSLNEKTEIRTGVGLFSDLYPAFFVDGAIQNFPNYNAVTVLSGNMATAGAGTVGAFANAGNQAIVSGFGAGSGFTQIQQALAAQGIPFTPPNFGAIFPNKFSIPEYLEYSLQVQRQLSKWDAIVVTYAGNYGYRGILVNPSYNATASNLIATAANVLDPRFLGVHAYTNNSHSNYNGGMVTYKVNGHNLLGQISYTYSHALDDISNGGSGLPFGNSAITTQVTPSLGVDNLNYGSSDYDIRHNLVGDLVYNQPHFRNSKLLDAFAGGWVWGGKLYYRSGNPFSVTNDGAITSNGILNLSGTAMATLNPGTTRHSLTNALAKNPSKCATVSCLDYADFQYKLDPANNSNNTISQPTFGNISRNALTGPHYADVDMSVMKKIVNLERFTFQIGANAYNVFNHPNFATPSSDVGSATFGQILSAVAPPTSPYGSFQGAAITQRLMVVHGKIVF